MNSWTFRVTTGVVLALFAGTALDLPAQTGYYSASDAGTIHRPQANKPANGASYDVGSLPTFPVALLPGDGSREVNTYCSVCHTPRYITMQPVLPAVAWADEVNKMIRVYGATVPDDAARKIIVYLQSQYTPETRKR